MELLSNNFILTKKVQVQFYSNFEGIFGSRTSGAPKKAPFTYVKTSPWVILFNSKLKNEVLDDIQTYRIEKHGNTISSRFVKFLRTLTFLYTSQSRLDIHCLLQIVKSKEMEISEIICDESDFSFVVNYSPNKMYFQFS